MYLLGGYVVFEFYELVKDRIRFSLFFVMLVFLVLFFVLAVGWIYFEDNHYPEK